MTQPQAYAVTEGDGLPVVFVHGMGVDHRSLMLLDEAFLCPESGAAASRSLKRIYLDLPGFGRTPALPARACGLPEMADWLQSAIDDLVGAGEPFALVGNSMGGALAREMVAREVPDVVWVRKRMPAMMPTTVRSTGAQFSCGIAEGSSQRMSVCSVSRGMPSIR